MNDIQSHEARYDCWLQHRDTYTGSLPEETLKKIFLMPAEGPLTHAAGELRRGLEKMFGISAKCGAKCGAGGGITLEIGAGGIPPEAFIIRAEDRGVIITGADEAGCLYGVYRFLALLAQGKICRGMEITDAPTTPIRALNHWDNLDGTIERGYAGASLFFKDNRVEYDPVRIQDYARLLASVGINRLSINNVNVRGPAKRLITEEYLPELAKLAAIFRPFGIRLLLSVNFSSPCSLGACASADPLDLAVAEWWKRRADMVYGAIPDLAGFLVKADSEGESGPFQYGRTHADGANMLAEAVAPHNGIVFWRCFVYNSTQDWRDTGVDRARAAYDHFMPLDGAFADNVILQIKHGPFDFQVREPVSPLFGALQKTRHLMELQITQEYTGHQIDLCYLPSMWEWVMNFDTRHGRNTAIKDLLGRSDGPGIGGLAGVGNVGLDRCWTGHPLAQANLYGYGRLAWQPSLSAQAIAEEWSALTFTNAQAAGTVEKLLLDSYRIYEKYTAPFGVCFMVTPGLHYGPDVEGYEFSRWGTYHRADREAIGIDRTETGTGYTGQYPPENAALFSDTSACPENLLLFFHRLRYDFKMRNGRTLLQNIYDTHFEGYDEARKMRDLWLSLEGRVCQTVFEIVKERLERQLENARQWRDVINTSFYRRTGIDDAQGRKIYR